MHCASFVILVAEQEMFLRVGPSGKRRYCPARVPLFYFFGNRRGLRKLISRSEILIYGELCVRLFNGISSMEEFCHYALKRNN
jgi:hypothetical protein